MNQNVLIHCKPEYLPQVKELGLDYTINSQLDEVDVKVPDVEYIDGNQPSQNGIWEDPDIQICEYYGIDYDQVNCIEAI